MIERVQSVANRRPVAGSPVSGATLTSPAPRAAGGLAAALVCLAACSSAASTVTGAADLATKAPTGAAAAGPATAAAGVAGGVAPSCAVVTPALVRSALGVPVGPADQQVADSVAVCTFVTTGAPRRTIIVRLQRNTDAASFTATRNGFTTTGQPTTTVPGVGDDAFTSELTAAALTTRTLVARHGSDEVLVSSPASLQQEEALVTQVFSHLT